mgnify:CR=1 FL=1
MTKPEKIAKVDVEELEAMVESRVKGMLTFNTENHKDCPAREFKKDNLKGYICTISQGGYCPSGQLYQRGDKKFCCAIRYMSYEEILKELEGNPERII